jgi:H+/gluconate symporter-like permease
MRVHRIVTDMLARFGASSKLNAEWEFVTMLFGEGRRAADAPISTCCCASVEMGLLGILIGLLLLVWLAFRGWSELVLAPAAALVAAAFGGQPLLANWTQIFMGSAATFLAQFFPLFLLGAVFGKLMEDSGSVTAVARYMTETLGKSRAMLAVVAAVTYGGVSLFVAFFVLAPMAQTLFRAAGFPAG